MHLPETIAYALANGPPRMANLVEMDFASGPMRVWTGFGTLRAGGQDWSGLGELGSISEIEQPVGGTAPECSVKLSWVDPAMVARALGDEAEYKGRIIRIYAQHFDDAWQALDSPVGIATGFMDVLKISAQALRTREIVLTFEWLFARRAISPFATLSDADQRALHPGDMFCSHISDMQNKVVTWPVF